MGNKSWDDYDALGREHRRITRMALRGIKKALEVSDDKSFDRWSITYTRHAHEILLLMQFERTVALDLGEDRTALREQAPAIPGR